MKNIKMSVVLVALLFALLLSSCSSELKNGAVEQVRLDLITEGMTQSEVRRILKVEYEDMPFSHADRYYLEDGRPVYVHYQTYNENDKEQSIVYRVQIDELVDPALLDKLTEDMTVDDVAELFSAEGIEATSGLRSRVYKLTDGREVRICYFTRPGEDLDNIYIDLDSVFIED
ncbi:MAG: hypothetical protein J6M03_00435 [Clostridia bacterium]|nr:hypothetical protein [Clostridia bacterium]